MTKNERRLQAENDALRAEVATLRAQVSALQLQVAELAARLGQNSTNSSKPPSTDPPWHTKAKPTPSPTGRKPGAQPGHKPHNRAVLEPTADEVYDCQRQQCPHCQAGLDESTVLAGKEALHQVVEIVSEPLVQNYLRALHKCHKCGKNSRSPLPQGVAPVAAGPRLQAIITTLVAKFHLSRADTKEALAQMFGVNLSVGAIHEVTERATMGTRPAVQEVAQALIAAATKHCDETGWRHCNKRAWMWVCTNPEIGAYFHIDERRNREAFAALLPELRGIIHTDRWTVYDIIAAVLHQLCHAHLRRDMQALVDLKGSAGEIGTRFLAASDAMFKVWHRFKAGEIDRAQLLVEMAPVQADWKTLANLAAEHTHNKVRALGKDLLKQWDSLWPFVVHEGAEPTNNHAERVIRPSVLLRKTNGGTRSQTGAQFVAQMQSVIATAKCQGVQLVGWLTSVFQALWAPVALPRLLPPAAAG